MDSIRQTLDLLEANSKQQLEQVKLPYAKSALSPVLSSTNVDFHYSKLYKGYVDRYNKGEGDKNFNEAGAYLHGIWFNQFTRPSTKQPHGAILDLINRNFKSYTNFKKEFREEALKVQGSGWIYLSRSGQLKVIKNHQKRTDIAFLVDMWEHSYQNDYHSDKGKYVDSLWRIVDWTAVNKRL